MGAVVVLATFVHLEYVCWGAVLAFLRADQAALVADCFFNGTALGWYRIPSNYIT